MAGTPVQTGSNRAPVQGSTNYGGRANSGSGPTNSQVPQGSHPTTQADIDSYNAYTAAKGINPNIPATADNTPAAKLPNVGNAAAATTAAPTTPSATTPTNAQAQANLANGGLTGDSLAAAQKSLTAFQTAHAQTSDQSVPQDAGTGMSAAGAAVANVPQAQDTTNVDQLFSQDPTVNGLMTNIATLLAPQQQTSSLMDDYNKLYSQSGLGDINKELIDANTVINGTEDDIRNEIQSAGGLGTNSQIEAMSLARNKGLIARVNQLTQEQTNAQNQLNTMMNLDSSDKQMAQTRINSQISNMFQLANFKQQATTNIQEGFNALVGKVGYAGALQAYSANPTALANIEKTMGLPVGGLQAIASIPDIDSELKQSQLVASQADIQHTNLENQQLENPAATEGATIANKVAENNAVQNAADQQTLNSAYSRLQSYFPGQNLATLTMSQVDNLSKSQQQDIGKLLNRIVSPDLARNGGDPGDALAAGTFDVFGKLGEGYNEFTTGKPYTSDAVLSAIKNANTIFQGTNNPTPVSNTPTLLTPDQIPAGMYQASDGLLYKK